MKLFLSLLASIIITSTAVAASDAKTEPVIKFSQSEIENLAAPIALYPDPLLGLILPASVFPDQIVDAALLIKSKSDAELIASQSWDASVKGVATYPGVLKMMFEKLDWTTKLGDAFLNQSEQLRNAIQNLRVKAQKVGNLKSTEEQKVTTDQVNGTTIIKIEPTTPQTVYVPQYSTQVVYSQPAPDNSNYLVPLATFGLGMALGSAMADDDDDVYIYGGYPGRVAWYDNGSVNHWVDNRQDMIRDAQSHRQDVQKDRINFNQDMREDRTNFRQDQIESGNWNKETAQQFNQEQKAKRQEQLNSARQNRENAKANIASSSEAQNYQARKQQAQQRSQEWRSSAADRGWNNGANASQSSSASRSNSSTRGATSSSGSRASALQGYSGRSAASAYSSRGSSSRSTSGYSGGSGRSISRSGGGGRRR